MIAPANEKKENNSRNQGCETVGSTSYGLEETFFFCTIVLFPSDVWQSGQIEYVASISTPHFLQIGIDQTSLTETEIPSSISFVKKSLSSSLDSITLLKLIVRSFS